MLIQNTLDKIKKLKLLGMLEAWDNINQSNEHVDLTATELLSLLVDHEVVYRKNKKHIRLLKNASLRFNSACLENVKQKSKLQREQLNQLLDTTWLLNKQNIIITGPTGAGKTYIACAAAAQACRNEFSAKYYKLSKLLEMLRIAKADGSYLQLTAKIAKYDCLIFDDWGIENIPEQKRCSLLDLVDDHYQAGSIIITSQLPVKHWHDYIGEPMIADAILDRILSNAIVIELDDIESMRKNNCGM